LDGELLRLVVMQPVRRRVNRSTIWPALDIAFALAVLLFTGSFLGNHWKTWSLVGPAIVVHIAAILFCIGTIHHLLRLSKIDWGGTVVDIQSSLSRLRMAKIRQFKWIILLSPLVWICSLIVGLQWLLDWRPGQHFILDELNPWWVAGNYAFGVLFVAFGHVVVGFLAKRFGSRGWWQRALDDMSGSSLKKARSELERWANSDSKF